MRNKLRQPTKIGVVMIVFIVAVTAIALFAISTNAQDKGFHYGSVSSLTGASQPQVAQFAVEYTQQEFRVLSGSPQVVLTRSVKAGELEGLGLDPVNLASIEEPPLMLVIVKGDFGLGTTTASTLDRDRWRFSYISYVFDEWSARSASTVASAKGGVFRKVLNDPSLPNDNTQSNTSGAAALIASQVTPSSSLTSPSLPQSGNASQFVVSPPYTKQLHYGDTAPTVAPKK